MYSCDVAHSATAALTLCSIMCYANRVIKDFAHKGLQRFFETGSKAGIQPKHDKRLRIILTALEGASDVQDMNLPTFRLHPLKGNMKGLWAVTVNGNWRIVFRFQSGDAYVVNYIDYH